jgi:anti-sigma regulatory factor (Ser/Thr protein kinase)
MSAHPRQTITLRNDRAEIPRLAAFIDAFCQPLGPAAEDLMSFHLALEEAVTNVIHHGYIDGQPHEFTVALAAAADGRVTAIVTDDAPAFDPVARAPVDTSLPLEQRPIGGLGVHLIKNLMDSVRYERRDGRNVLTLEWRSVRPRPV